MSIFVFTRGFFFFLLFFFFSLFIYVCVSPLFWGGKDERAFDRALWVIQWPLTELFGENRYWFWAGDVPDEEPEFEEPQV